jgi:hypothetical protein
MEVLIFQSIFDFLKRFPADEAILPVAIHTPADGNCAFYNIVIALPVQNRFYECRIYNVRASDVKRYKNAARRQFELAIQLKLQ